MTVADDLAARMVVDGLDRQVWLDARQGKIGGSNAAQFAKLESAPGYTRAMLAEQWNGNQYTRHGTDRERHMLAAFNIRQNLALYHAAGNPLHVSTPDAIVIPAMGGDPIIAECKTSNKPIVKPSPAYIRQCQWNMYVIGASRCLFIWEEHDRFTPVDVEPNSLWIDRDDLIIGNLITIADTVLDAFEGARQFRKEIQES